MTGHLQTAEFFADAFEKAKIGIYELQPTLNQYYGVKGEPWYHALTPYGVITVGHRKRVYSIDWSHAWGVDHEMMVEKLKLESMPGTNAQITFDRTFCHAWTPEKFQEYLNHLNLCFVLDEVAEKRLQQLKDSLMGKITECSASLHKMTSTAKLINVNEWHIKFPHGKGK